MSAQFSRLHENGTFLLVNVHDAASAAVAQAAGAVAIGTTSSGHAWSVGRRDATGALSKHEVIDRTAQICAAVDIPVSIDAENGWGSTPTDVADAVQRLAQVGAAGASIEDWSGDPDVGHYDRVLAVERIEAAVDAASGLAQPFTLCARADGYLHTGPDALPDVLERLQSFAAAGANCVYAPGPTDRETIDLLVREAGAPVNVLVGIGSTITMDDLSRLGVRRVSVGGSLYRATLSHLAAIVEKLVTTGRFDIEVSPMAAITVEALLHPHKP